MRIFPGPFSYILIIIVAIVDAIWIGISNITFPMHQLVDTGSIIAFLLPMIAIINKLEYSNEKIQYTFYRLGYLLQGIIFLQLSWIAVRLFNHISMSSNFPYVDSMLIYWDTSIGFDWVSYFYFIQNSDIIRQIMGYSYTSLTLFSFLGFLILMVQGELKRTRFFLETFLVTAVTCTAIGMFFPAKAAVAMHYGDTTTLANLSTLPGVYHIEALERLRSGQPFSLDLNNLPGLVTFPSFHTAAGIILVASFWRTALFPIVFAYSVIMIASTPVLGGHYFIDLIGGAAIAALIIWAYGSLPFYKGLFRRPNTSASQPATTGQQVREPT